MAALPYMQLYVADYLADTMHLTAEEHGAYLLLIMNYWQTGKPLNNRNGRLASVARVSNDRWIFVEQTLAEFFNIDGDIWTHKRVEQELAHVRRQQDQRSAAGKASASARIKKGNERPLNDRSTTVERPLNKRSTNPLPDTDTDTDTEKKNKKRAEARNVDRPHDVSQQVWQDFMAHRKSQRAPVTATALQGIEREAAKAGMSLNDALRVCCERGWRGFKAEWVGQAAGLPYSATTAKNIDRLSEWADAKVRQSEAGDVVGGDGRDVREGNFASIGRDVFQRP